MRRPHFGEVGHHLPSEWTGIALAAARCRPLRSSAHRRRFRFTSMDATYRELGGSEGSAAKVKASRDNGTRGGRPKDKEAA